MIIDWLLHAFTLAFVAIINVFPVFSMPANITGSFVEIVSWIKVIGFYVPLDTAVFCIFQYLTVWLACIVISALVQLL